MRLQCSRAEPEECTGFFIAQTSSEQTQYFLFPKRKDFGKVILFRGQGCFKRNDTRTNKRVPSKQSADRRDQDLRLVILMHEARKVRGNRLMQQVIFADAGYPAQFYAGVILPKSVHQPDRIVTVHTVVDESTISAAKRR